MDSLAELVGFVREFLAAEKMSEDAAFDVDLVLEELFTNLVRHGRGAGDVEVELSRAPGELRIRLRAAEPSPFDPTAAPRVNVHLPIEERRPGGLGIHFVRELCHIFRYEWSDGVGTTLVVMGVTD
ncbi:MAG: ATP-binding protein [Candidatus Eisenbacteria bacterium]|nr:ATP-binding protein [Candidatus Eisenbacteria bacterium]